MKKRNLIILLLILSCCLLFSPAALASQNYQPYAEALSPLGVFIGTENGFELDRTPTRTEGIVMLIRLLGAEQEALNLQKATTPFIDVPQWANGYVAYAYQNGLSNGIDTTLFGAEDAMDARMYVTFLLRSLGYSDQAGDFQYTTSVHFAYQIGLVQPQQYQEIQNSAFLRGHVAKLSYDALKFSYHNTDTMLIERLVQNNKINKEKSQTFLATIITNSNPNTNATKTTEEIAKNAESVVILFAQTATGLSQGSGVVLSNDGVIVTNYHVIDGAQEIQVGFQDNTIYDGSVIVQDFNQELDLAVIKINKTGLKPVIVGDSSKIALGQNIVAIGSPMGLKNTVSEGIVSGLWSDAIQISAPISHGSSGGALFNMQGELIGITYAGMTEGQNLGFAIPSNELKKVNGQKALSLASFLTQTAKITPPTNIHIVSETENEVVLNWTPVPGADYYYIYYKSADETDYWYDTENGQQARYYYQSDGGVSYYNLQRGQTYYIMMTSVKDGVESAYSQVFTFTKKSGANQPTSQQSIVFYKEWPWIPDFGAMYGYPVYLESTDFKMYSWVDSSAITDYHRLLTACGFVFDSEATQIAIKIMKTPIAYKHPYYKGIVVTDVMTTEDGTPVFAISYIDIAQ